VDHKAVTSELENWWLVTYQDNNDNRWALFNTRESAEYFYNRLSGAGPYRYITAVSPLEVASKLAQLTA
jgi:hypothetical protein